MSNIPQPAARSAVSWNLSGNSGTNAATQFLGTTDEQPLVIKANNAEALRVTFTGNIGIGTTSPISKLTVQAEGYGLVHTDGTRSVGSWVGTGANADGGWLGTRSNHPLYFFTNNGDASMTLDVNGNLGIGTTAPTAKLTVQTGGYGLEQTDGTASVASYVDARGGWLGTRTNHPLYFFTRDGPAQMTLDPGGNLGIGGPSGGEKLGVEGTTDLIGTDRAALYVYSDTNWEAINARSARGAALVATSFIGDIIIEGLSGDLSSIPPRQQWCLYSGLGLRRGAASSGGPVRL